VYLFNVFIVVKLLTFAIIPSSDQLAQCHQAEIGRGYIFHHMNHITPSTNHIRQLWHYHIKTQNTCNNYESYAWPTKVA